MGLMDWRDAAESVIAFGSLSLIDSEDAALRLRRYQDEKQVELELLWTGIPPTPAIMRRLRLDVGEKLVPGLREAGITILPGAPADVTGVGSSALPTASPSPDNSGLTARDRAILDHEERWWDWAAPGHSNFPPGFKITRANYPKLLKQVIRKPAAYEYAPLVVARLRRLERQREVSRTATRRIFVEAGPKEDALSPAPDSLLVSTTKFPWPLPTMVPEWTVQELQAWGRGLEYLLLLPRFSDDDAIRLLAERIVSEWDESSRDVMTEAAHRSGLQLRSERRVLARRIFLLAWGLGASRYSVLAAYHLANLVKRTEAELAQDGFLYAAKSPEARVSAAALLNLGLLYRKSGNAQLALECYSRAFDRGENELQGKVAWNAAILHMAINQSGEARIWISRGAALPGAGGDRCRDWLSGADAGASMPTPALE